MPIVMGDASAAAVLVSAGGTSLLTLVRNIALELGYAQGVPSAAGATTTIIDTSGDSPIDSADSSSKFKNAWVKIEADSAGTPLDVGEVRRISSVNTATSTITVSRAFSNATTTTMTYGLYCGVPPTTQGATKGILQYLNDTLRQTRYRTRTLLTLVADGDMETSGTANWSATNATREKTTTVASVVLGQQGLTVTNSSANGYAYPATYLSVVPGQVLHCRADFLPTSGTAKLQLYDITNSAEIESDTATAGVSGWRYMALYGTVPTSCRQVSVRLIGVEATAVITWDNVSLRYASARTMALPSWVTTRAAVEELEYWSGGSASDSGDDYAWEGQEPESSSTWEIVEDYGAGTPYRIRYAPEPSAQELLVVRGLRFGSELSADADQTDVDPDYVKAAVLSRIYEDHGRPAELAGWPGRLARAPWKPARRSIRMSH